MRQRIIIRLAVFTVALAISGGRFFNNHAAADTGYPLGREFFTLDYARAFHTAVREGTWERLPPTAPFPVSLWKHKYSPSYHTPALSLLDQSNPQKVRLLAVPQIAYRSNRYERGTDLGSLTIGARTQFSSSLGGLVLFTFDRERALDPDYPGKTWRGMAGDIDHATLSYHSQHWTLTAGRQRVFWGPQPVNLLLSQTAEPLDQASVTYRRGILQFNFLFAQLDQSRPHELDSLRYPDESFQDNRYLAAHRLDLTFWKRLRVGVFETALFGGHGVPPKLSYLNPLQSFHSSQLNNGQDDNTMVGLDISVLPMKGLSLYGQLLIDDLQVDNEVQSDQEPNEIGILLSTFLAGEIGTIRPDVKIEYTRIANRTYHQRQPRNRFLYRNTLLGHPLGPDADSVAFAVRFWPGTTQMMEISAGYTRHGEGSIYRPWSEPWLLVTGDYNEPFPSGIVEKKFGLAVRYSGYLPIGPASSRRVFLSTQAGYATIDNRANVLDDDGTDVWFRVAISYLGAFDVDLGK